MKKYSWMLLFVFISSQVYAQQETVPINEDQQPGAVSVYQFINNMFAAGYIKEYDAGDPNLSRKQVMDYLKEISIHHEELNLIEKNLLKRMQITWCDSTITDENYTQLLNFSNPYTTPIAKRFEGIISDKEKSLYQFKNDVISVHLEGLANITDAIQVSPTIDNNSWTINAGIRLRGTVLNLIGYNLTFRYGASGGALEQTSLANIANVASNNSPTNKTFYNDLTFALPQLKYYFFIYESAARNTTDKALIPQYNFIQGNVRFGYEPTKDMLLSAELGINTLKLGYGVGSSLILSGENPDMGFIKTQFKYGVFSFGGVYSMGVGPYTYSPTEMIKKYFAFHYIRFSFPGIVSFRFWDMVVTKQPDFAYFIPIVMYKFIEEHATQAADNGLFGFDAQTTFIKNLQLNFTFILDDMSSNSSGYGTKYAFQANLFWYKALGIQNLSAAIEYTHIRPFTYHHTSQNSYTDYGVSVGHRAGPNSQDFYIQLGYYPIEWCYLTAFARLTRSGENIDENGKFIKDVGRNPNLLLPSGYSILTTVPFLDGVRLDTYTYGIKARFEFRKNYILALYYEQSFKKWIETGTVQLAGAAYAQLIIEY